MIASKLKYASLASIMLLAACTSSPGPEYWAAIEAEQVARYEQQQAERIYHEEQVRLRAEQETQNKLNIFKQELSDAGYFSSIDNALNISDERFIFINIPSQILRVFENGQEVLRTKIIIGTEEQQTPQYSSNIWGVKFNPDWTVPPRGNIERRYTELLAEGKEQQLIDLDIRWRKRKDGTLQFYQPSGNGNVLGMVKFEMFSPTNVYLHDTNRRDFYNLAERTISNGCVRVQAWDDLTAWLLGVSKQEVYDMLEDTRMRTTRIRPVPIHMVYWTKELIDGKLVEWEDRYNKGKRSILNDRQFLPSSSS